MSKDTGSLDVTDTGIRITVHRTDGTSSASGTCTDEVTVEMLMHYAERLARCLRLPYKDVQKEAMRQDEVARRDAYAKKLVQQLRMEE